MRRALTSAILTLLLLVPFAAQSEAAESFARSLAELIQPDVIEPGDAADAGPCVLSLQAERAACPDPFGFFDLVFEGLTLVRQPALAGFVPKVEGRLDPPWPSHCRARRLASLQTFLC